MISQEAASEGRMLTVRILICEIATRNGLHNPSSCEQDKHSQREREKERKKEGKRKREREACEEFLLTTVIGKERPN